MTFKITIARQPFAVEFEAGSVGEAVGILQAEDTEFAKLFGISFGGSTGEAATPHPDQVGTPKERKPRGPNKPKPAEPASAPAPVVIPAATTALPPNTLNDGIPAFLDRTAQAAPPPPAPPVPPAPPTPVAPTGVLAGKMIPVLEGKAAANPDAGPALAKWLSDPAPTGCGLLKLGATFAEAIDGLRFIPDEKLGPVAAALGVAA